MNYRLDELSLGQIDVEPQEKSLITNAFNFIAELELIDIYLDIQPKRQQPFHTKYGKTFSRDDPKRKWGKRIIRKAGRRVLRDDTISAPEIAEKRKLNNDGVGEKRIHHLEMCSLWLCVFFDFF